MNSIDLFDAVTLSFIIIFGAKGLFSGFIREFFSLIGIIGGVYLASTFAIETGQLLKSLAPLELSNSTFTLIGFALSLAVFWVIAYILGVIVYKIFSVSGLGVFDIIFGFLFSATKVFLIFATVIALVAKVTFIKSIIDEKTINSFMYPLFYKAGTKIISIDTTKIQKSLSNNFGNVVDDAKDVFSDATATKKENNTSEIKDENETKDHDDKNETKKYVDKNETLSKDLNKSIIDDGLEKIEKLNKLQKIYEEVTAE